MFVSDYPNFHQLGLWDEFVKNEVDFLFLATDHISEERKSMHYEELTRDYIKQSSDFNFDHLKEILCGADSVILGHVADKRIYKASKGCKKIYFNNEHFLKKHKLSNILVYLKRIYLLHFYYRKSNKYALCNSYYAGKEYKSFFLKKTHIHNFGYFPKLDIVKKETFDNSVMFSARCLDWKMPLLALDGFKLFNQKLNSNLTYIGEGPFLNKTHTYAHDLNIFNNIEWKEFFPHDQLMNKMNDSTYYLFTSNHQEGWGVILNEALSKGMIVIANIKAGSTKLLVRNGYNGFTFNGSRKDLLKVIAKICLLSNEQLKEISNNATNSIKDIFNNVNASKNLYNLLINNKVAEEGPCSYWKK